MTPLRVFRVVAVAEAITWALLLAGMFLKYVTETTELGVQVFGMVHGVVFIAYGLTAIVVGIDQQWSLPRRVLSLVSAVPPFMTLWFERYAERRGLLDEHWHSHQESATRAQRAVCWLLRHHRATIPLALAAIVGLTGLALVVGPPTG